MKAIYMLNWLNYLFITGGYWTIGTDPKTNLGGLCTIRTGFSHPPASGWEYGIENGNWIEDPQITVSGENLDF